MKLKSTLMAGVSTATVALSAQAVFAGDMGKLQLRISSNGQCLLNMQNNWELMTRNLASR